MGRRLACLLLCGVAVAGWDEARERFQQAYRADTGAAQRKEALLELARADVPEAAETLLGVWRTLEEEVGRQRAELAKLRAKQRDLRRKLKDPRTRDPDPLREQIAAANEADGARNTRLAALEIEQAAILQGIRAMRAPETVSWLAGRGLQDARAPALLAAVADAVAAGGGLPALLGALDRARQPEVAVPLLAALEPRASGLDAPALTTVLRQLSSRDPAVRGMAALVVARAARPEGVGALVRQIAKEKKGSRAQLELARALAVLTGVNYGPEPEQWALWWRDNEAKVLAGEIALGAGRTPVMKSDQGNFYGLPQVAQRIVYVLDTSGSMEVSMEHPRFVDGGPVAARDDEDSRFDVALRELLHASRQLRPDARYAVVVYSDHAEAVLEDDLVPATKENHARLEQALAHVGAAGMTNVYEALDLALRLANVHAQARGPSKADAIYLISDGSPTDAQGRVEDPERVLQAVRDWNGLRRVAIHTVGIGREHNAAFLKQLAQENGGEYTAVLPK